MKIDIRWPYNIALFRKSWKFERVRIWSNRDEPDRSVLNRGKSDGLFLQQTKSCLTTLLHVTKSNTWRKKPRDEADETHDRSFIPFYQVLYSTKNHMLV